MIPACCKVRAATATDGRRTPSGEELLGEQEIISSGAIPKRFEDQRAK